MSIAAITSTRTGTASGTNAAEGVGMSAAEGTGMSPEDGASPATPTPAPASTPAPATAPQGVLERIRPRMLWRTPAGHVWGPLPELLLILTAVTGLVDAVSILALGRVF